MYVVVGVDGGTYLLANFTNALRGMNEGLVVVVSKSLHVLLDAETLVTSNDRLLCQAFDAIRCQLAQVLLFLGLQVITVLGISIQQLY
jgi:hypothetical protein